MFFGTVPSQNAKRSSGNPEKCGVSPPNRSMVKAELLGSHSHPTSNGPIVNIYLRDGKYLARGSYGGARYGVTLGSDKDSASRSLRNLLADIEEGRFRRPSDKSKKRFPHVISQRLTLRDLINSFIEDTLLRLGDDTAESYASRLAHILNYADQATVKRSHPFACDVDRAFALGLRAYLHDVSTSKNGHPNSEKKPLADKHIRNILETLRSLFNWALKPELRKLPVDWCNPVTIDFIGPKIRKNPLREDPLPIDTRIMLVENMDLLELYRLSWSIVLPLRSSEVSGIMISDVDMYKAHIWVGERLDGFDFTKGRTSFVMPFPVEFRPLLSFCIGRRAEGPLILKPEYLRNSPDFQPCSQEEFIQKFMIHIASGSQKKIRCKNDRKSAFRKFLYNQCGGISDKQMNTLFKTVCERVELRNVCIRNLRESVSTSMARAGLRHLEQRFLTSHTISDIMNDYVSLEPLSEMQKYFASIQPLLTAIEHRLKLFGIA